MLCLAWRILRVPASYVASAIVLGILILGCAPDLATTDAGADPDISACCRCLYLPTCGVQACFEDVVRDIDGGARCHWLTCGGGLFTYHAGACQ